MRRRWTLVLAVVVTLGASHALRGVQDDERRAPGADLAALRQARVEVARQAIAAFQVEHEQGVGDGGGGGGASLATRGEWHRRLADARDRRDR